MHKRQVIREYVAALLMNNTTAGANVFDKRVDPTEVVPRITITARRDVVLELHAEEPVVYQRVLSLDLNIETEGDEDVANALADEVELLLLGDYTLGGNAVRSVLTETNLDPSSDGANVFYDASIALDVDYLSTFIRV